MPTDRITPTIRQATADDLDTIVAFNIMLALESEAKKLDREVVTRGAQRMLDDATLGRYFMAEHDGHVLGQMMITFEWSDWRCGMFWWVQSVYVRPELRKMGVFRALYEHVERLARADAGVCGMRLYVERENISAMATYQRLGMYPAGYLVCENDWSGAVEEA